MQIGARMTTNGRGLFWGNVGHPKKFERNWEENDEQNRIWEREKESKKWFQWDLNPRPLRYQHNALPAEPWNPLVILQASLFRIWRLTVIKLIDPERKNKSEAQYYWLHHLYHLTKMFSRGIEPRSGACRAPILTTRLRELSIAVRFQSHFLIWQQHLPMERRRMSLCHHID